MSSDRVDKADKGAKIITVSCWGGPFKEQPTYHFTSFTRFEIWILFEATDNRQYGASRTLCFHVRLCVTIANLTINNIHFWKGVVKKLCLQDLSWNLKF